ncbi:MULTISPECIES: PadR family transcriptional regulator [Alicyclobacillus]|uniref:DNA-binding transcriptional regulator, PadR family n=1 Tax=Alicyclobacillus macrosporangiidus TaxID=392015 RepID=A0A1I7LGY0_9BACL|nr:MULTISPECIES: PadR family transcriptional regulator [Alicyclobacillus]SFV08948.1 DNA-binding transcriptional regulator, PadR family [Alicyclobacillus macrosporangiidus]
MYELVILGFLMRSVSHGYRIVKIINDIIGPYAKLSSGRLYPLFEKLARDGQIEATNAQGKGTRQREYIITEKGKQRFHQLMMDTVSNPGEYKKLFQMKMVFWDLIEPNEQLYLLDHYRNYCQTHIFHLDHEIEDLQNRHRDIGDYVESSISVMTHIKAEWELELEWVEKMKQGTEGAN